MDGSTYWTSLREGKISEMKYRTELCRRHYSVKQGLKGTQDKVRGSNMSKLEFQKEILKRESVRSNSSRGDGQRFPEVLKKWIWEVSLQVI